jgi:Fe2+ or Zn2+ uptake regulation protein
LLHSVGLCSTRQRSALVSLLLRTRKRRVTAEILYDEAQSAVSRPTVYNALRQFEQAGLLRRTAVHNSKKAWFAIVETNADGPHRVLTDDRELSFGEADRYRRQVSKQSKAGLVPSAACSLCGEW